MRQEDDNNEDDYVHQETFTNDEMRSFTAKELVKILKERGVVVSIEIATGCSALRGCLQEVLLEEQDNVCIKNCLSTSSGGCRETRALKKQKQDVQKRQEKHNFFKDIRKKHYC